MAKIEDCPGFETFGADIKAARKAKHLTRKDLAEKGIFFAPHPVDFIEILGADGRIRFAPDVSLRFHEIKDIIIVTLDRFPVFPDTVTLCEFEVVGNKPL